MVGLDFHPSSLAQSGGRVLDKVTGKGIRPPSQPLTEILQRPTKTMAFHQLSSLSLNILALGWHNYINISEFRTAKHNPGLGSVALSKRDALGQQPEENHN